MESQADGFKCNTKMKFCGKKLGYNSWYIHICGQECILRGCGLPQLLSWLTTDSWIQLEDTSLIYMYSKLS